MDRNEKERADEGNCLLASKSKTGWDCLIIIYFTLDVLGSFILFYSIVQETDRQKYLGLLAILSFGGLQGIELDSLLSNEVASEMSPLPMELSCGGS
jgi:hypothetical protein